MEGVEHGQMPLLPHRLQNRWPSEEHKRHQGVAGRSAARIKQVMDDLPELKTADFEIVETAGTLEDLARIFDGAKVVCNTAGRFIYNGPRVIEAALNAGCHYIDIGGEQTWIREVADNWGDKFRERGLVAAPATAFMCAVSDASAWLCRDLAQSIPSKP